MIRDKTVSKRIHFFSRCKQIHFSCVFYVFFSWDFQENDVTLIFFWRVYGAWMVSSPGLGLDLTHVRVFLYDVIWFYLSRVWCVDDVIW